MCRWIRDYSTCVLAPSQASLNAFNKYSGCGGKPAGVIWNCVDASAYAASFDRIATRSRLGLPREGPVIVYVARFVPHKNHVFLASVAEQLDRLGIRASFAVAGSDGEARGEFEQRVADRSDFKIFVNPPDITPLLRCADIFLFPSTEEGFGTVAIEAAAAGLPVVASDLPAIREACAPSHRRYMFARDDFRTAALNIEAILGDPALYARLRGDAKDWAQQFSADAVVAHLGAIYRTGRPCAAECEAVAQ
jgi:glycosyltransferase involved in cell wall biosynthesis